ncbi:MAG TPA: hypothetical protein VHS96_12395, partial [Bacteroidia bacterium]|nr:hypothetical protein [Bacteroidia bacterium]
LNIPAFEAGPTLQRIVNGPVGKENSTGIINFMDDMYLLGAKKAFLSEVMRFHLVDFCAFALDADSVFHVLKDDR